MTAAAIQALLKDRFPSPEFAVLPEVRSSTGFSTGTRFADALVMSCFPSRGLDLFGFEIKVIRSDWLRELKKPDKAEAIAQFCDFWFVVAPDDSIVQRGELPTNWGLLTVGKNGKLQQVKDAVRLTPKNITRTFLASILRSAMTTLTPKSEIDDVVEAKVKSQLAAAKKLWESQHAHEINVATQRADRWEACIKEFEAASGIRLNTFSGAKVGTQFAKFQRLYGDPGAAQTLTQAIQTLDKLRGEAAMALEAITKPAAESEQK